ncbi:hypothetical protein DFJ74DRAFT_56354 [Hyaloraphidium curvatum]|nr:hypothetical protein DFJ74DRAFT_56354 [Hyaloraphidium curvatum]
MACALPSCNQKGANTCGTCRKVFYCTREHQIDDWPRHKLNCVAPVPRKTGTDGYPAEELVVLFPKLDEAGSNFMDVLPPNKARNPTHLPLLFRSVLEREQLALKGKAIVDRATFKRQFSALTSNLFDSFPEKLWENVLIAGGSVLAALLPLDNGFANRRPPLTASRYYHYDFRPLGWSEKRKSMQDFMLTCRWPSGDVDIFLYGLKGQQATSKMIEIFTFLKSRFVELSGSSEGSDCVFIKTENTVTMETGSPRRKIQVILREYKSKEEALNEFDLDCVCVGYDGREVLATPRALKAISTRVNVVDLSIRGTAYESRLLKYAERGFAVAIPGLDLSMVDKGHLVLKREPTYWNKDEDALTSDSWDRWTEAENLLRLLLGDAIATSEGYIEFPFPGRMRRAHGMEERIDSWSLRLFDNYPGTRRGVRDWPATMKLSEFRAAKGPFAISWKEGSMPRQPLPFDKWSEGCFKGSTRPLTYKESWRERFAARSKDKKEEAAKPASADQAAEPPKPARAPTPDIPAPVISPRVLAAEAWVVAFKTLLPEVREASSEAVAELYRRLHPSSALPAVNLAWEKLEEFKDSEGGVSRTTQREPVKPVAAARSIAPSRRRGTEPRVWLANRVFRELKEHDESLLKKLQEIFEDSRGIWQAGKKVADGVFEGRLSDRARFFFLQLDSAPPSFLVTAVTLTHKGINKLITHSMELAKKVREAPGTAIAEGRSEMDAEIAEHARLTLSVMRSFREDAGKVSWFLPRLHLGNLEMIVEIGRDGTAVPLLTEQEMEALDMALKQGCVVVVKGSAGNGKTTVLGEIAAQVDGSLLCLPSERHKAQVLRTYPTVRALTVRERLEEIWPRDWRRGGQL